MSVVDLSERYTGFDHVFNVWSVESRRVVRDRSRVKRRRAADLGCRLLHRLRDRVDLLRHRVDRACQLRVELQLLLLLLEVAVRFRLLERGLPVLTDHDERRQEDRLQRHDERQELERVPVSSEQPRRDPEREHRHCTQTNAMDPAYAVIRSARRSCQSSARFLSSGGRPASVVSRGALAAAVPGHRARSSTWWPSSRGRSARHPERAAAGAARLPILGTNAPAHRSRSASGRSRWRRRTAWQRKRSRRHWTAVPRWVSRSPAGSRAACSPYQCASCACARCGVCRECSPRRSPCNTLCQVGLPVHHIYGLCNRNIFSILGIRRSVCHIKVPHCSVFFWYPVRMKCELARPGPFTL